MIGLAKLNLEPDSASYMAECVAAGKTWFVIRKRWKARCIQASGSTREDVERTLKGWPGSTLVQVIDNKIHWHKQGE